MKLFLKKRISKYYEEQKPSTKEFADFLKHEYGIGGHTADDPVAFVDYSTKGIEFTLDGNSKTDGERFGFNWTEVAKHIANLIDKGEYLTDKEIEKSVETPVQEEISSENITQKQLEEIKDISKENPKEKTENFTITDDSLGEGGAKTKFKNNLLAIQTLKQIESEDRTATPKEQEIMSKYVGWGGLSQAFDSENKAWENEFKQLRDVLNDTEYNDARARKSIFKNIYLFYEKM